jgi:hypothetical protein
MEIIKRLSGLAEPPSGRMLVGDLRTMAFRNMQLRRDPQCRVCGKS